MAEQQLSENVDNLIARGKMLQQQGKHAEALPAGQMRGFPTNTTARWVR